MTKTPQHNVPELRFPEFEGEWNILKLNEVLLDKTEGIKRGPFGGALKKEIFVNEGYAIYEQRNAIYDNQEFRYYINKDKYEEMKSFEVQPGDLIMSCSGTIGKLSKIPKDYKKGIINQALIRFRTKSNILSQYFLFYMRSNIMQRKILEVNPGSAITNLIPVKELKNLCFPLPNLNEQQKIGNFFSKLDRQIELEEKKLELLEQQKKGYMQKIFSQELRFKDENGKDYPEWEEKKLGEETSITMGQSPKSQNYTSDEQNTVLIQGNADLNNGEIYPRIYTTQITKMAEIKDIILSVRAPVGEIAIAQIEACIGRGVCAIKGSKFIYMYLEYLKQINYWKKITQGSTFESISSKDIKNIIFYKPDEKEQAKIADFLSQIDKLIKDQAFKLEYLKQRKRGLLQKMFI